MERELLKDLSRYYPLGEGRKRWNRSLLLSQGKHGHDRSTYDDLPLTQILLSHGRSEGLPCPSGAL